MRLEWEELQKEIEHHLSSTILGVDCLPSQFLACHISEALEALVGYIHIHEVVRLEVDSLR